MESTQQSDRETYRAIVFGQSGDQLLLAPATGGFLLPSVEIPRWQRIAETLTAAMRREWGHEVVCLFNPDVSAPISSTNHPNYQVMESHGPEAESSPRAEWVRVASLSAAAFADPADYMAVQRSLTECAGYSDGLARGPFAKLGWFRQLQEWIEGVIGPLGFHLTESFSQLNASPSFSLVRFKTTGPAVWFKAVGKPNLREFPITLALAQRFPKYTAQVLATRPAWSAWVSLEKEGLNLSETRNIETWAAAVTALAQLQIASIGHQAQLLDSGARNLGPSVLSNRVSPFLAVMCQLMEEQPKVPPPALSRNELLLLGEELHAGIAAMRDSEIPQTLGHLDLNPGNIIVAQNGCAFLDWAEAYVGPPFFSFEYILEHFRHAVGTDLAVVTQLRASYAAQWKAVISPSQIENALAVAPMLAAFAYAASGDVWSGPRKISDQKTAGYFRSLTRRMKREADRFSNPRLRYSRAI